MRTTADSFNARVAVQHRLARRAGAPPLAADPSSAADQATLKTFSVDPNALSGSFLVDAHDTITDGVLLRPGRLGSTFDPAGLGQGQGRARLDARRRAARDPLRRDDRAAQLRLRRRHPGQDADQRAGCLRLRAGADQRLALQPGDPWTRSASRSSTATWRFLDSNGAVIASTLGNGLGSQVPDPRLRDALRGVAPDRRQARHQRRRTRRRVARGVHPEPFGVRRSPLAGPLQSAGLILVLLLLAVGLTLTVVAGAATAPVARAGAAAARAQPVAGRVHLGRLPRAAHTGLRCARLPADQPRPLGRR